MNSFNGIPNVNNITNISNISTIPTSSSTSSTTSNPPNNLNVDLSVFNVVPFDPSITQIPQTPESEIASSSNQQGKKNQTKKRKGMDDSIVAADDPKAKRRAQIAKAARKHRQRQKDELAQLRSKVSELEEQIAVLQSSEPSEHSSENGWKQEARQQAEMRARVDRENEFLRVTLVEQLRFTQRLQDLFTKQPLLNVSSMDNLLSSDSSSSSSSTNLTQTIGTLTSSTISSLPQIENGTTLDVIPHPTTVSFKPQLMEIANKATSFANDDYETGKRIFQNKSMSYMDVDVQYEMTGSELCVFLRRVEYGLTIEQLSNAIWSASKDKDFHEAFGFIDSFKILDTLDENTIYQRLVYILMNTNEMKAENIGVLRRVVEKHQTVFSFHSVDDPNYAKLPGLVRQTVRNSMILRPVIDPEKGNGVEMVWCIMTAILRNAESEYSQISDIILKNVFECTPLWFRAMIDRARNS